MSRNVYTQCTIAALALQGGIKGIHIPLYKYKYQVNNKLQITLDRQQQKNVNQSFTPNATVNNVRIQAAASIMLDRRINLKTAPTRNDFFVSLFLPYTPRCVRVFVRA